MYKIFSIVCAVFIISSCSQNKERMTVEDTSSLKLLELVDSEKSGLDFNNEIVETMVINSFTYDGLLQGSGVAVLDVDNDGFEDVYFASTQGKDQLYRNKGNMTFENITTAAGILQGDYYSTGISVVDINNDGFDDIYVNRFMHTDPNKRRNLLYVNNGNSTFTEAAANYGLADTGYSTCATFFDMDGDNDLDVYIGNQPPNDFFSKQDMKNKKDYQYTDRLYKNQNGTYVDFTQLGGVTNYCYTLSVNPIDFDQDGDIDLMIAADYEEPDLLLRNKGNGSFENVGEQSFRHISNFSMGVDIADINNDGNLDIFSVDMVAEDNFRQKTNMGGMNPEKFWKLAANGYHHQYMFNALHLNNGNGMFSEIAQLSGISNTDWSWAPLFVDIDQDGLQDVMITNGVYKEVRNKDYDNWRKDYFKKAQEEAIKNGTKVQYDPLEVSNKAPSVKIANFVYRNDGDLEFSKMNDAWDFDKGSWSSGAAYADFDNDGDMDFVINNSNMTAFLYDNKANDLGLNNYIKINLEGPAGNTHGYGAEVQITYGDQVQRAQLNPYRGYMSSCEDAIHFGLKAQNKIAELMVKWPDGKTAIYNDLLANQTITLKHSDAGGTYQKKRNATMFLNVKQNESIVYMDNIYDDYKKEILLPHKMSTLGPVVAVADINGDGNDDMYMGGARGVSGNIFLGSASGQFTKAQNGVFGKDQNYEDGAAEFFDADGDGDMDLYVGSGGNESPAGDKIYADRLYINNGGTFSKGKIAGLNVSTGAVAIGDYDADGDNDIFVGGRQTPGKYGYAPLSYFLENVDGNFVKKDEIEMGMVTDAIFADIDGDKKVELILGGEWMPISIYSYDGQWSEKTDVAQLGKSDGWWNRLEVVDMDGDGDLDILAGNLGKNLKFKASEEQPFKLYVDDFDANGSNDVYLGYYGSDGNLYPVRGRQCSSEQMPFVKSEFATYEDFGSATITEVLDNKMGANTVKEEVYTFATSYFRNNGNGKFDVIELPNMAQISPTFGFAVMDINRDGKKDFFAAGNYYNREVETTRSDAGTGYAAIQKDDNTFEIVPTSKTGINAYKDVREVREMKAGKNTLVAIFNNGAEAQFYSLK